MAKYGKHSIERKETCHKVLQILADRVIKRRNVCITEGHRGEAKQDEYFYLGTSGLKWPFSKHNKIPSLAFDMVPWPEKWSSKVAFLEIRTIIREEWQAMKQVRQPIPDGDLFEIVDLTEGFDLRWGGDWDSDGVYELRDCPHWELV